MLSFERLLSASPARAFAAITEARHLERWFCDACSSEPRPDGTLVMRWMRPGASARPFVARWLACDAPRHASFRGGHSGYPGGDAGEVTFMLEAEGTGCRARVRHTVPAGPAYAPLLVEWRAAWPRALERLVGYLSSARSSRP